MPSHPACDDDIPLEDRLYIDQVDVDKNVAEQFQIKTVCSDQQCTQQLKFFGKQRVFYLSNCHLPCQCLYHDFSDLADVADHPDMKSCVAFEDKKENENCAVCGHHWKEHVLKDTRYREVQIQLLDPNIQKMFDANKNKQEIIQEAIKSTKEMVKTLETEQEQIINAGNKLANFIKKNAVICYNPCLKEYIDMLIREKE